MDALTAFITNPSAISLIFSLLVIVILYIAAKKGIISYNAHGIKFGSAESEAKIRNMQQLFAKALFEGTVSTLPESCEYYHKRFVISQCLDEVERLIRENHITSDDVYIETEYQIIYNIVLKYTTLDYFRSLEFQEYLKKLVTKLIKQLESIRKTYSTV